MTHLKASYRRFFYRYGSVLVPITALGVVYTGMIFLMTDRGFDSPAYHYVFGTIPRPVWGMMFVIVGLVALAGVAWYTTLPLMVVIAMWACMWVLAAFDGVVPAHAPVGWAIIALSLTAAVARRGIRG